MTQKDLAKELNTDQATVSRWEKDQLNMSTPSLIKVALYFGVSTDDLLGVEHNDTEHTTV